MRNNENRTPEWNVKADIRDYMRKTGWLILPIPATMYSVKGVPDYVAIRAGKVVFIEAKAKRGVQSKEQKIMQAAIEAEGIPYILAKSSEDVEKALVSLGLAQSLFGANK